MKKVQENLFQFNEYKFFQLFEEEEEADVKEIASEQEEVGTSVVEKAKENFSRFEKDAKGIVIRYKQFWEENEAMKANFEEGAKVYKMFDSNYVVGLMKLPDEALEPEVIDQELDTAVEQDEKSEADEKEEKVNEAVEEPEEENELGFEPVETPETPETETPVGQPDSLKKDIPVEEHPVEDAEEEVLDTPGEPKMCLVVYNMANEQREEIFRSSNNPTMHAFEDFYENTFKGAMKAIIAKARAKQEEIKKQREVEAKEQEIAAKKTKVDQFLKESSNLNESFAEWYAENRESEILRNEYLEAVYDLPKGEKPTFKQWCKTYYEYQERN